MAESEDKMEDRSAVQPIGNLPEKNLICGVNHFIFLVIKNSRKFSLNQIIYIDRLIIYIERVIESDF